MVAMLRLTFRCLKLVGKLAKSFTMKSRWQTDRGDSLREPLSTSVIGPMAAVANPATVV